MRIAIVASVLAVAACHHHSGVDEPVQPQPQVAQPQEVAQPEAQPEPPPAPVDPLAGTGCTREDSGRVMCPQDDGWPVYITYLEGATQIDSFEWRAFAQPCRKFKNAMHDLAANGDGFLVACDDDSQQFRFSTTLAILPDTDFVAWVNSHLSHRKNAVAMLRSIGATRQQQ